MKLDLTIGQKLAVGFTLMLLILAVLLVSVARTHEASAAAQAAFTRQIAPLTERAAELERALYEIAVAARNYLISPDDASLAEYRSASEGGRDALRALHEAPKSGAGEALYRDLVPLVYAYLLAVDRAVEERSSQRLGQRAEITLDRARARALSAIHDFSRYQAASTRAALAGMSVARDRVTRDLRLGSALALLWFVAVALATARSVSRPTRELVKVAHGFETGLWKPALPWAPASQQGTSPPEPRNEMAKLRRALGAAAAALEKREQRLYADGQVASATAASLDTDEIADRVLLTIVEQVRAEAAVLYVRDDCGEMLQPVATYALHGHAAAVCVGEGLPGEAAKLCRPVFARDIPPDTPFRVKLGFDQVVPKAIAAIPVLFRREALGVMVIASLHDLDEDDITFLRVASGQLAIGLRNASSHRETQRLLEAVRKSNEQIAAQNAHLQAQNDEIQAQHEEIQAQSEEITAQNAEITTQNDQLREQAEELSSQREALEAHAAELAKADEHKDRFLNVLAHEMRNPMAPIANALYLLEHDPQASEQARRAAAIIARQTQYLRVLVDDLADIARIGQGRLRIERAPVDIARVVTSCIEDQQLVSQEREVTIQKQVPASAIWVNGDAARLAQIASSLLVNAIKFSKDGGSVIVALSRDEPRQEVVLEVADEGAGIDPAILPRLFEPFSQAAEAKGRTSGLSLGLALVKALTELHGGTVGAQSAGPDRGARFTVRLPLSYDAPRAQAKEDTVAHLELAILRHGL